MKLIFPAFIFTCILFSCVQKKNVVTTESGGEKTKLMETDKAFSDMSEEKGMKNAFIEFIDSNGVLLTPNQYPITGAAAIDHLIQQNDTSYSLTWKPNRAFVSKSGELGYTYGVYTLKPKTQDTALYGTYVKIWKKMEDGKWKFVLDSGNEGLGE